MRTLLATIAAAATLAALSNAAGAQSFDCESQSGPTERVICADPRLSALDERLAYWYARAQHRAGFFDQTLWLRDQQRAWLASRDACGPDMRCIRRAYVERIRRLRDYVEHV